MTAGGKGGGRSRSRLSPPLADYAEFAPDPALAPYVACVWTFEGGASREVQRIVPDGCCELVVHFGDPYFERDTAGRWVRQPRLLFAGQLTRPLHLCARAPVRTLAVRFRPAGAWAYIASPLEHFTDRRMSLEKVIGADAAVLRRALSSPAADHRALLERHVVERIGCAAAPRDAVVASVAERIERGKSLQAALTGAPVTARTLQRRFQRIIGLSPRTLAAILRLRRVLDELRGASPATWTEAAQAAGYFDQPQMVRDFKRFVGCSPSEFAAALPGLASSIAASAR